jgi:hypothetical protein
MAVKQKKRIEEEEEVDGGYAGAPTLALTPTRSVAVDGNFDRVLSYLTARAQQIDMMELTEDNVEQAKLIKKEALWYQKDLDKRLGETVERLFDGPKAALKLRMSPLYEVINRIAGRAAGVLDAIEAERKAGLGKAYEAYIADFQKAYGLDEERLGGIELRKWYYNKTPADNELQAKRDIEEQFKEAKRSQDAHAADVRMIEALCEGEPRLNSALWIEQLDGAAASAVAHKIMLEKQRLAELDAAKAAAELGAVKAAAEAGALDDEDDDEEDGEDGPTAASLGMAEIVSKLPDKSDFPGRMLEKAVVLRYPCDYGDAITELFRELKKHGITVRALPAADAQDAEAC